MKSSSIGTVLQDFPENLPRVWKEKISPIAQETYFKNLVQFLEAECDAKKNIYPDRKVIFRALESVDFPDVRVVILGQDPYHGQGQATGLSFAVPNECFPKPPSLRNIFKEIESDFSLVLPKNQSDLTGWAEQGVLLLNTVLTVQASEPLSHRDRGWELFTDRVLAELNRRKEPIIFVLWGSHAQKKKSSINLSRHVVLESAHPSPLSAYRGFMGSKVFSKVNQHLVRFGGGPIRWEHISLSSQD